MGVDRNNYHSLEVTLTGSNNRTLKGIFNFTAIGASSLQAEAEEDYDADGAASFVIAVILVYGLSIVMLIGSLAKRKLKHKQEDTEEKQIDRYLNQANNLREKGARENYKNLKQKVITLVSLQTPTGSPTSSYSPRTGPIGQTGLGYRSMTPVESPLAAGHCHSAATASTSLATSAESSATRNPFFSDADSTKALLDSTDERLAEDEIFGGSPTPRRVSGLVRGDSFASGKLSSTSGEGSPVLLPWRGGGAGGGGGVAQRALGYGYVPRVVVTESRSAPRLPRDRLLSPTHTRRPPDQVAKSGSHDVSVKMPDDESSIIYDVGDGKPSGDVNHDCRLSMDAAGNIWILKSGNEEDPLTSKHPMHEMDQIIPDPNVDIDPSKPQNGPSLNNIELASRLHSRRLTESPAVAPGSEQSRASCPAVCHPGHHQSIGQVTRSRRSPSPMEQDSPGPIEPPPPLIRDWRSGALAPEPPRLGQEGARSELQHSIFGSPHLRESSPEDAVQITTV